MLHKMETLALGASESDALCHLHELKQQLRTQSTPVTARGLTVNSYAVQWLKARAARLRPSAAARYEQTLSLHILPEIGAIYLDQLTRSDVEAWIARAEKKKQASKQPYTHDTVCGWYRVLVTMLKDAVAEFSLPRDPTLRVRGPKVRARYKRERSTLTIEQVRALVAATKQFCPTRYAEVACMAYTGMRAGEVYGLHWEDIDEALGVIHIRRSVWMGHESTTKTDDPRDVPLLTELATILQEHRSAKHPGRKTELGRALVFPSETGGYRITQSLAKALTLASEGAKIPIRATPQVLRRTFNTLMVANGVDRIVLRAMMGHTSEDMTRRYAGVSLDLKREAVDRVLGKTDGEQSASEE